MNQLYIYNRSIAVYQHGPATSENRARKSLYGISGQFTSPLREITTPSSDSCRISVVSFTVWHMHLQPHVHIHIVHFEQKSCLSLICSARHFEKVWTNGSTGQNPHQIVTFFRRITAYEILCGLASFHIWHNFAYLHVCMYITGLH